MKRNRNIDSYTAMRMVTKKCHIFVQRVIMLTDENGVGLQDHTFCHLMGS